VPPRCCSRFAAVVLTDGRRLDPPGRIGDHLVGIVAGEHDVIGTDRELLSLLTGQDGQPSGVVGVSGSSVGVLPRRRIRS